MAFGIGKVDPLATAPWYERMNPFGEFVPAAEKGARADALLQMGLGMLASNQGNYGSFLPALSRGGMMGLQAYQQALQSQGAKKRQGLQDRLLQSQIGEVTAQAQERSAKMAESKRMLAARQGLISEMDNVYASETSSGLDSNGLGANPATPAASAALTQQPPGVAESPEGVTAPKVTFSATKAWEQTPNLLRYAATRALGYGDKDYAKQLLDQAESLEKLNKVKDPAQVLHVGGGGNVQEDYYFDPTGKAPGKRLTADPRYVLAGTRQAVPSTNIGIENKGEEAYTKQFGGKVADDDVRLYQAAQKAPDRAVRANTVLQLLNSGAPITGFGAEFRLNFARAAQLAGVKDESVMNTESLSKELASSTLDAIAESGLGTGNGFTDKDREFLTDAKSGRITMSAETLTRVAELHHRAAEQSVKKWQSRFKMMPQSAKNATGVTDQFELPPLMSPQQKGKPRVLKFDSQGNQIK